MNLVPVTVKAAMKFNAEHHRHLKKVQGGLFAVGVAYSDGELRGVCIACNPWRVWQGTGRFVIGRTPVIEGTKNACSMLLGAICRAAKALGYSEAWTYTLPHEPGTSLRAAGFEFMGMSVGGSHSRESRRREEPVQGGPKLRWRRVL